MSSLVGLYKLTMADKQDHGFGGLLGCLDQQLIDMICLVLRFELHNLYLLRVLHGNDILCLKIS